MISSVSQTPTFNAEIIQSEILLFQLPLLQLSVSTNRSSRMSTYCRAFVFNLLLSVFMTDALDSSLSLLIELEN